MCGGGEINKERERINGENKWKDLRGEVKGEGGEEEEQQWTLEMLSDTRRKLLCLWWLLGEL